jgi:hypothetical protein
MAGNRFIDLIEAGRIPDAAALRRAFRQLAKRVHPDIGAGKEAGPAAGTLADGGEAGRRFMALRRDYEDALDFLETGKKPAAPGAAMRDTGEAGAEQAGGAAAAAAPPGGARGPAPPPPPNPWPWDRRAFYECLEDLAARGFPKRPKAAWPARHYDSARDRLLHYLAGRDQVWPEDRALAAFLEFEEGWSGLREAGWLNVDNDGRRSLYYLFTNIVSYHELGFAHMVRFARNTLPVTQEILAKAGTAKPLAFLRLLVADLDKGPAIGSY